MQDRIALKIDVSKIDKSRLYEGKKGVYLDAIVMHNQGESKYGDDGFIIQSLPKEARDNGERGAIIGNWRYIKSTGDSGQESPKSGEAIPF